MWYNLFFKFMKCSLFYTYRLRVKGNEVIANITLYVLPVFGDFTQLTLMLKELKDWWWCNLMIDGDAI